MAYICHTFTITDTNIYKGLYKSIQKFTGMKSQYYEVSSEVSKASINDFSFFYEEFLELH